MINNKIINFYLFKILKSKIFLVILSAFVGAIVFINIFGTKVINPNYSNWILNDRSDITQHYVGWLFFKNDSWHFPLGKIKSYGYPYGISLTNTDSIPLFAFIFKLFKNFLSENFQYFGIWELFCFIMQAILTGLIFRLFTKNNLIIFFCLILFCLSPPMIDKTFYHSALSAHWIILLYLYFFLIERKKEISIICWCLIGVLTVLIHPYFLIMLLAVYIGSKINVILNDNNLFKKSIFDFFILIISIVFTIFIIGAYEFNTKLQALGFGYYSWNLNSFFNPMGWSIILRDFKTFTNGQYEGFSYFGFGMIIAFFFNCIILVQKKLNLKKINYGFIFIFISLILFSSTNKITFFDKALIKYPITDFLQNFWAIFRATGRMIWPVYYLILIFILKNIVELRIKYRNIIIPIILLAVLLIQIIDISPKLISKKIRYTQNIKYDYPLKSDFWNVAINDIKHIAIYPNYDNYDIFAQYAIKNNLTLNTGYFSRDYINIDEYSNSLLEKINNGDFENNYLFVIQDIKIINKLVLLKNKKFFIYNIDGFYILLNRLIYNYKFFIIK